MNNIKTDIQEDAKSAWMKIVDKHKKKQKGLPALSTLNTNAGNVEHNINMFNMMQPDGNMSVDASNGNISGDACCESYSLHESNEHETVTLEYENIPVEVVTRSGNPSGYYSTSFGNWLPDDDETAELLITWNYEVDKQDVIEYLQELDELFVFFNIDPNIDDESLNNFIQDNFDTIVEKFDDNIKEYFYDYAVRNARENYVYEDDPDYEFYDESLSSVKYNAELDDKFDMSMRTLL